jgi:hypothetical protein
MPAFMLAWAMRTVVARRTSHLIFRLRHESQARVAIDLLREAIQENARGEKGKFSMYEVGASKLTPWDGGRSTQELTIEATE